MNKQSKIITVMGAALFLSLSANLFMVGQMAGQSYHHRDGGPRHEDSRREEWKKRDAALREKLPEADRAIVEEHMKTMREKFKGLRDAMDAAEDKADAAKAADPFDQQAYEAALKEQAAAKAALIGTVKASRAGLMEKLSPEGRKVMKEMGPRFKGREGRGRDGRDGWRRHDRDRDGERGGRFFDRRPEGPHDWERAGYGQSAPPPPEGAPPAPRGPPA